MNNDFRKLPQVNEIINHFPYSRALVKEVAGEVLDEYRQKIFAGIDFTTEEIYDEIEKRIDNYNPYTLQKVINATGVIIHTNLGRDVLSEKAIERIVEIASSYSNLEYNLEEGKRGSRYNHIVDLVKRLTGAEDALIVNNNAAAVFLVLNTLCKDKEAIISRGELVEIGESFRISEIMAQSGTRLVEVGATNKTHIEDYEGAISEDTAAIVKVHKSNFKMVGFTNELDMEEIKDLAQKNDLFVYEDLGSGSLVDLSKYGFSKERTVSECIKEGVDLVSFSCDKLLGSTQGGIICGRKNLIQKIKKNQLLRAFRVGKLTLAAVEATLMDYLDEENLIKNNPTLAMITAKKEDTRLKAEKLKDIVGQIPGLEVELEESFGKVGGGAYPDEKIPSYSLAIKNENPEDLEKFLRLSDDHIISTIYDGKVHLNLLTIFEGQFPTVKKVLEAYYG